MGHKKPKLIFSFKVINIDKLKRTFYIFLLLNDNNLKHQKNKLVQSAHLKIVLLDTGALYVYLNVALWDHTHLVLF